MAQDDDQARSGKEDADLMQDLPDEQLDDLQQSENEQEDTQ
jgi:hypothetical protein